jgi:hypothetical protein
MLVRLHANAATTPKMRAYIQASGRPVAEPANLSGRNTFAGKGASARTLCQHGASPCRSRSQAP